jgi:hypothetical protein
MRKCQPVNRLGGGLGLVGLLATAGMAQESPAVTVLLQPTVIMITPGRVSHFAAMTVRIVDSTDRVVLDAQSSGEPVVWAPAPGAPGGHYRYEAVTVTRDASRVDAGEDENNPGGVALLRRAGSFSVSGGVISAPTSGEAAHPPVNRRPGPSSRLRGGFVAWAAALVPTDVAGIPRMGRWGPRARSRRSGSMPGGSRAGTAGGSAC